MLQFGLSVVAGTSWGWRWCLVKISMYTLLAIYFRTVRDLKSWQGLMMKAL